MLLIFSQNWTTSGHKPVLHISFSWKRERFSLRAFKRSLCSFVEFPWQAFQVIRPLQRVPLIWGLLQAYKQYLLVILRVCLCLFVCSTWTCKIVELCWIVNTFCRLWGKIKFVIVVVVVFDDEFLYSHHLSGWQYIDTVKRNEKFSCNRFLVANIFLGLRLPHLDTEFGVYFMIAFCVGLVPVVALEIYVMCGKKQEGKS